MRALTDPPRTQIGPYQLIAKIGEGGMGTVWLTKLPGPAGFNKLAVVKELRADLTGSSEFVELFLNEARLAARLTHPNVIHTYGANEDQGRLYIAMEYLDGQPWSQVRHALWSNRSLPLALHLKVLADALTGLHYAHELRDYDGTPLQVVHRDMSPQNVFVTYDGLVKVVDFGVARAVTSRRAQERGGTSVRPSAPRSEAPVFVGKIAYSPPEQIRGENVDRRADVFAVGVMLWEALAGRRLMEGQERSEAVRKRALEPAPRIRDVVASVPRVLSDICDRALALDPHDRYSTAAEFRDAIVSYLNETSPDIDSAQLGQLVGNAFRDERSRINGLIERSLMRSTPTAPPPVESLIDTVRPPAPVEHTIRADLSELASVSTLTDDAAIIEASNSVVSSRMPLRDDHRTQRNMLLVVLGVIVGLFVVFLGIRLATQTDEVTVQPLPLTPPSTTQTEPSARTPGKSTPSPSQPGTPTEVMLDISAKPARARLYLDGAPLSNPFRGKLKVDGALHILRVAAEGMQTQEKVIQLDGDAALHFELIPIAARTGPAPGERGERGARDRVAPPAEQPRPAGERKGDDYDMRITPEVAPRPIYEEDPY
jgi:serine/threonine-protein kinase